MIVKLPAVCHALCAAAVLLSSSTVCSCACPLTGAACLMLLSDPVVGVCVCVCLHTIGSRNPGGWDKAVWGPGIPAAREGEQSGGGAWDYFPAAPAGESTVSKQCDQEKGTQCFYFLFHHYIEPALNSQSCSYIAKKNISWIQANSTNIPLY